MTKQEWAESELARVRKLVAKLEARNEALKSLCRRYQEIINTQREQDKS